MAPELPKLPCIYLVLTLRQTFWSISLYDQPFLTQKVLKNQKNRKCAKHQNDVEHLTVGVPTMYNLLL